MKPVDKLKNEVQEKFPNVNLDKFNVNELSMLNDVKGKEVK